MNQLINTVIEWCKVVAKAPLTYLTILAGTLTIAADELAVAAGIDHPAVVTVLRAVALIGVAARMIRRSTPVLAESRSVLPVQGPVTSNEQYLGRELNQLREVMQAQIEGR